MTYDFVQELKNIGALKTGHFVLASGRHSDQYVEKFDLLRQPRATAEACSALIEQVDSTEAIELVVGPTTGGILMAFEIARQLGIPAAYAERAEEGSSERTFKRGTWIDPGTRCLVVDDILTTGGSINATLAALEQARAKVEAIAVLVDRSNGTATFDAPLLSLARLEIATWDADALPSWLADVPITKPGSTAQPHAERSD